MVSHQRLTAALSAFAIHIVVSLLIAIVVGAFVFLWWFPHPHRLLVGGDFLFMVMIGVDVVCGPLLTALIFNPQKKKRELLLDLSVIVLVQLLALVYGVNSLAKARPIAMVYEVDRFVIVTAAQLDGAELAHAPVAFQSLPWFGPMIIGTREPRNSAEMLESVEMSLRGVEPSLRPSWWCGYEENRLLVKMHMRPLKELREKQPPSVRNVIDAKVKEFQLLINEVYYVPLVSAKSLDDWVVLLNPEADIIGYAPVGGF
ncbi:hypothetical protein [Diaphorobacter nitroreducens]|uniref:hypothetical protein n=1 Tax=Diaphorobacter nitroreducens TaxID=164759 RepID=UPI00289ABF61|nr:hypothetical protein [Diaphorobacter nitroreducens]